MSAGRIIAARAYNRVGSDFGFANVERVALYGGLVLVGYLAFKTWRVISTAKEAATWAAGKAGTGLANAFEWFAPFDIGETLFYAVKFPDGMQHAVPSRSVSALGYFTWSGKRYRLAVDKRILSGVNKFAVPA